MLSNEVTLTIPCAPEYVSVVRLTMLAVASRLGFSYDAAEDIRLAVAEACTDAIARSRNVPAVREMCRITIKAISAADHLVVEVRDNIPGDVLHVGLGEGPESFEGTELSVMLMGICMDEYSIHDTPEGHTVRLVKWNERPMTL